MTPLEQVKAIRAHNNEYWMGILELALRVAPEETRRLLAEINKNDGKITRLLKEI